MPTTIDIKRKGNRQLCGFGDFHVGNLGFDEEKFLRHIDLIKNMKNADVIVMGDIIDAISHDDKRYQYNEMDKRFDGVEDTLYYVIDKLRPIKDKIIGIIEGNHEGKLSIRNEFNYTKFVANELDAFWCHESLFLNYKLDKINMPILAIHPYSGGTTIGGQVNKVMKFINAFEVPPIITLAGHFHSLDVLTFERFKGDFSTLQKHYLAMTGSYLRGYGEGRSSYASRSMYTPKGTGFVSFEISKGKVDRFNLHG